ncbi:Hypothetical predicted protein, partial [Paramuricea clavata]
MLSWFRLELMLGIHGAEQCEIILCRGELPLDAILSISYCSLHDAINDEQEQRTGWICCVLVTLFYSYPDLVPVRMMSPSSILRTQSYAVYVVIIIS